jgi:hypothetical protein
MDRLSHAKNAEAASETVFLNLTVSDGTCMSEEARDKLAIIQPINVAVGT